MGCDFRMVSADGKQRLHMLLFAFLWFAGLLLGLRAAHLPGSAYTSLMLAAFESRVSIVGLAAVLLLPFLFSAFAVFISQPWLLLPIAFGKAVAFGCCVGGISVAFGSAGWLARWLLMFSDCCMLPVLCWFWLRCLSGGKMPAKDLAVCVTAAVVIGSLDYGIVSPFLAKLIDS